MLYKMAESVMFGIIVVLSHGLLSMADSIEISLYPSNKLIFIGEKTIVNTTIHFKRPVYQDVHVTLYPSMDGPDMYMRRILGIHIGRNLQIAGRILPLMDWGRKDSVPGEFLACEYFLGTVKRVPKSARAKDDVITIQYEAIMGAEGTYEDGDDHIIGASVKTADDFAILTKHATMRSRTLPLLFHALNKETKIHPAVYQMVMDRANGTKFAY